MITALSILSIILLVLIIAVFVFGILRKKGKTFPKYENMTDDFDKKIIKKHNQLNLSIKGASENFNLNIKGVFAWILKLLLDILHVVTKRVSIRITKLRSKYHKKTKDSTPSSPSEYLRKVGESPEDK